MQNCTIITAGKKKKENGGKCTSSCKKCGSDWCTTEQRVLIPILRTSALASSAGLPERTISRIDANWGKVAVRMSWTGACRRSSVRYS
jgi:hypothetical protein